MKAARWHARRDMRLESVPMPVPRADEAVVAVEWVGLCGSDAEEYREGPIVVKNPVTLGHEIVGTITRAAADGSGLPTGCRVVVDVVTGCGRCFWCQRHDEGLCPNLVVTGQHIDGGLAEFVIGRANRLVPVPDTLDPQHAVLAEPLAVAVRAVRKVGSIHGADILVVGGGAIGMLTAQVARRSGANSVLVLEPDESRRRLLSDWGIVGLWAGNPHVRKQRIAGMTTARGIDVVFECSGRPGMSAEAARLARPGGTIVLLGVLSGREPMDILDIVLHEKRLCGSAAHMWDDDVRVAVSMLDARSIQVAPMITHTRPLEDVIDAFEVLLDPGQQVIKLLVQVKNS